MEKRMEECADEIMQQDPSVRGVLCSDSNGALLCARGSLAPAGDGTAAAHSAAVASQLANLATALEPNAQPLALILSCSTGRPSPLPMPSSLSATPNSSASSMVPSTTGVAKVLIKRDGPVIVALHK